MNHKKRVIALGFFDGFHIGHAALLKRTIEVGAERGLVPSVMTFDTHPHSFVTDTPQLLINSTEDRANLLHRIFGIDDIIFLHFNKETAVMRWDIFIDNLAHEFGAEYVIAGYDYRFGRYGAGNAKLLEQKCAEQGIGCDIIPEVRIDGIAVSSSYVRELIANGNMDRASAFLGHPHVLTDIVRQGYRFGRTLGTPTINMSFGNGVLIPAFGVYAVKVFLDDGSEHIGITNISAGEKSPIHHNSQGADKTEQVTAETHILDFRGNLYGHRVRIEFHKHLRPEIEFNDSTTLINQIQKDCSAAKIYFSKREAQKNT